MPDVEITSAHGLDQSLPRLLDPERAPRQSAGEGADPSRQLRNGLYGFTTGLVVLVPLVLWHTGRLGAPEPAARSPAVVISPVAVRPIEQATSDLKSSARRPEAAARDAVGAPPGIAASTVYAVPGTPPVSANDALSAGLATSSGAGTGAPGKASGTAEVASPGQSVPTSSVLALASSGRPITEGGGAVPEVDAAIDNLATRLEVARGLILDGDVLAARAVLAEAALGSVPEAAYVLAETYDPNVLAALGITDIKAEVELARLFYERALGGGVIPARQRLEALR